MILDIFKLAEIILDLCKNAEYYTNENLIHDKLNEIEHKLDLIDAQMKGIKK